MSSEQGILESLALSCRLALGRRATGLRLELLALGFALVQAVTMALFLAIWDATLRSAPSGQIHHVQMTGPLWLYSLPAAVVITAIGVVDWLTTLFLLYVGLVGTFRHPKSPGLLILSVALLDIAITNVPYMDLYRVGLWTVELTASRLDVDYANLFYRKRFTIAELERLKAVCVEEHTSFRWRRTLSANLLYGNGQRGRVSVGGFHLGVVRAALEGVQGEFRTALKLAAERVGAEYLERAPGGCEPPPPSEARESGAATSPQPEKDGGVRIMRDPFSAALLGWICFLFVGTRLHWAQRWGAAEVRGCLLQFYVLGEGLLGGLLRAVFLSIVPGFLLAWGLHSLVAPVRIPAPIAGPEIETMGAQLALLIAAVDLLATVRATTSGHPMTIEFAFGLPAFYYCNLAVAWLLGWLLIAFGKAQTTSLGVGLAFFLPPAVWHGRIGSVAAFAFLLTLSIRTSVALSWWRAESLRARWARRR